MRNHKLAGFDRFVQSPVSFFDSSAMTSQEELSQRGAPPSGLGETANPLQGDGGDGGGGGERRFDVASPRVSIEMRNARANSRLSGIAPNLDHFISSTHSMAVDSLTNMAGQVSDNVVNPLMERFGMHEDAFTRIQGHPECVAAHHTRR